MEDTIDFGPSAVPTKELLEALRQAHACERCLKQAKKTVGSRDARHRKALSWAIACDECAKGVLGTVLARAAELGMKAVKEAEQRRSN